MITPEGGPVITPPQNSGPTTPFQSPHVEGATADFNDFSRAVRVALDPTVMSQSAISLRQEAEGYLVSLKDHPQIWSFCHSILQKPVASQEVFWSCGVLIELIERGVYSNHSEAGKQSFESTLITWASEICPQLELPKQLFVQSKFAQLTVCAFQYSGYPSRWSGFFDQFFALLPKGVNLIDLWLRVLQNIDSSIVNRDVARDAMQRQRDTLIKDTMRVTCIPQVANTWYNIIANLHTTRPDIVRYCMQVMCPYFEWIDINLVSSKEWTDLFYFFAEKEDMRVAAVSCLVELSRKRIADTSAKLQLIRNLRVAEAMPRIMSQVLSRYRPQLTDDIFNEEDGTEFLSTVGELCQVVTLEVMEVLSNRLTANQGGTEEPICLLETTLPMVIQLLLCQQTSISHRVCEYSVRKYVELLKKHPQLSRAHIPTLLSAVSKRLEYIQGYNFETAGDFEDNFQDLRKQLLIVFKNLCFLEKDLSEQFIHEKIKSAIRNAHNPTEIWPAAEAALRLLYTFGDELGTTKGQLFKQHDSNISIMMTELVKSNLAQSVMHPSACMAYLDVIERYYQYFCNFSEARPVLLQQVLGQSGASHPNTKVRAKACVTFSALAKSMRHLFVDMTELITTSIQKLLEQTTDSAVKCALYETLGILIAPRNAENPEHHSQANHQLARYLQVVISPLHDHMQMAINNPHDSLAVQVAEVIMYLANLSKGFSGLSSPAMGKLPEEICLMWKNIASTVVSTSSIYGGLQAVREKSLLFAHRMIDLLGPGVTVYIVPLLRNISANADISDIAKVVRIPTQMLQRIKGEVVQPLDEFFSQLIQRVFEVTDFAWLSKSSLMTSEQAREHLELLRAYYTLLVQASQPECIGIFLTDRSRPLLSKILESLGKGCVSHPEMEIAKLCYQV